MKNKLLKGLDYMYQTPPSKWSLPLILRFKANLLPELIEFVTNAEDQPAKDQQDISAVAEELFKNG